MPALNRVQLIGRLGKEPESKYTPTGKLVTDFSVAISQRWKDNDGETRERPSREPHAIGLHEPADQRRCRQRPHQHAGAADLRDR